MLSVPHTSETPVLLGKPLPDQRKLILGMSRLLFSLGLRLLDTPLGAQTSPLALALALAFALHSHTLCRLASTLG